MQHDGTGNTCGGSSRIMAPSVGGQAENFLWSTCSAQYLQSFLRYLYAEKLHDTEVTYLVSYNSSVAATCLNDVQSPISDHDVDPTALVGLTYGADDQCKSEYGPGAVFCPFSFAIQVSKLSSKYQQFCIYACKIGSMLTSVVSTKWRILYDQKCSCCRWH